NYVPTGIQPWSARQSRFVSDYVSPLVRLKAQCCGLNKRVGTLADCNYHCVYVKTVFGAFYWKSFAAATFVVLAEFHVDNLHTVHPTASVTKEGGRITQNHDLFSFFSRVL